MKKLFVLLLLGVCMPSFRFTTVGQQVDTAQTVTRTLLGNSLKPPRPVDLAVDTISNDRVVTWDEALASHLFQPEKYIIRVRDSGTNALKRTQTVIASTIPATWTYFSGAGDQSKVTVSNDGSISAVAGTTDDLFYHSQDFAGQGKIEWEVDSRLFLGLYVLDSGGNVKAEVTNAFLLGGGDPQFIDADVASGLRHRLLPATKIGIESTDGQPNFLLDDQFWMRGYAGPLPDPFHLRVWLNTNVGSPLSEPQAFLRVRVTPQHPRQFIYTAAMLLQDFGSSPGTVIIEVTQVSTLGIESAIATVTG